MPKHNIYQRAADDTNCGEHRLELQWQRESFVTVAVTRWAGEPADPDPNREYIDGDGSIKSPAWDGRIIVLERDQINHLIRQLRNARDQAFGKDE
jgi:hypothetical protein